MRQHVVYESRLELARIMLADQDPDVVAIAAQPFRMAGPDGDRVRRHVPDLLLALSSGEFCVVDVKAASRLAGFGSITTCWAPASRRSRETWRPTRPKPQTM